MQTKRRKITAVRDANILKDFLRMFKKSKLRTFEIYYKLSKKYYLDENTISRIITKQTKLEATSNPADKIP